MAVNLDLQKEIIKYKLLILPNFIYRNISKLFPMKIKQILKDNDKR